MKKIIALALSALLLIGAAVVGTVAFLTDTDQAVNVMTSGNIEIEQYEKQRQGDKLVDFKNSDMYPAFTVDSEKSWGECVKDFSVNGKTYSFWDPEQVKNVKDNIVYVENTGKNAAYVRTFFAFENPFGKDFAEKVVLNWSSAVTAKALGNAPIDNTTYAIYVVTYEEAIAPGAFSAPSLLQFAFAETADNADMKAIDGSLEVLAFTQAVQTEGFSNEDDAAATALNRAFTADHPWGDNSIQYVSDASELANAVANGSKTVLLSNGTYEMPTRNNGELTIIGTGKDVVINLNTANGSLGGSDVTFSNVTIKGANEDYTGLQHVGDVVYNDCVFDQSTNLYGDSVTFNNCVFNLTSRYIWTYGAKVVTFNNCVFNTAGKGILVYTEDSKADFVVNVNNCIFNATQKGYTGSGDHCAAVEIDGSLVTAYTVNFTGSNVVDADFAGLYRIKKQKNPANVTVNQNGSTVTTVSSADALADALSKGGNVILTEDVEMESATAAPYGNKYAVKMDGGVLDGNGNELYMECYGDDYGVMTSGGTIKNLTITEGCRAIMIMYPKTDVILDNVKIGGDGVLYPINTGEGGAEGVNLIVTNSTLAGWTSFGLIESASFTNVKFEQGTYYNNIYGRVLKPYVNTTLTDCSFVEHMNLDLSSLAAGHKIVMKNCTVNGQAVTAEVFTIPTTDEQYDKELFTVDLPSWATSITDCIIFQ